MMTLDDVKNDSVTALYANWYDSDVTQDVDGVVHFVMDTGLLTQGYTKISMRFGYSENMQG